MPPIRPSARTAIAHMKLIAGNSNRPLAEAISAYLNVPLTRASIRRFSDMEIFVEHAGDCPRPLFDTQVAAALLGLGDQIADHIRGQFQCCGICGRHAAVRRRRSGNNQHVA